MYHEKDKESVARRVAELLGRIKGQWFLYAKYTREDGEYTIVYDNVLDGRRAVEPLGYLGGNVTTVLACHLVGNRSVAARRASVAAILDVVPDSVALTFNVKIVLGADSIDTSIEL